ncbi:hypothetical protein BDZ85DRAFT_259131 [Elsinoe ampelina]|uniref:Uncharacterized protein n=1 Tax=Elsinoe ampelina TaxID=302913 RepID=A0A6A6GGF9_9PEZI|nr:hypothetical protein BDZ85DRAFT_259131 [Elsinoe ampelina]
MTGLAQSVAEGGPEQRISEGQETPQKLIKDALKSCLQDWEPLKTHACKGEVIGQDENPGLSVKDIGRVDLNVEDLDALQVDIARLTSSGHAVGHNVWEIPGGEITVDDGWKQTMYDPIIPDVFDDLDVLEEYEVNLELRCIRIHGEGANLGHAFKESKRPEAYATLVVQLITPHTGGDVCLCWNNRECHWLSGKDPAGSVTYAAWYHGVEVNAMTPVTEGYQVLLIYDLVGDCDGEPPVQALKRAADQDAAINEAFRSWRQLEDCSTEPVIPHLFYDMGRAIDPGEDTELWHVHQKVVSSLLALAASNGLVVFEARAQRYIEGKCMSHDDSDYDNNASDYGSFWPTEIPKVRTIHQVRNTTWGANWIFHPGLTTWGCIPPSIFDPMINDPVSWGAITQQTYQNFSVDVNCKQRYDRAVAVIVPSEYNDAYNLDQSLRCTWYECRMAVIPLIKDLTKTLNMSPDDSIASRQLAHLLDVVIAVFRPPHTGKHNRCRASVSCHVEICKRMVYAALVLRDADRIQGIFDVLQAVSGVVHHEGIGRCIPLDVSGEFLSKLATAIQNDTITTKETANAITNLRTKSSVFVSPGARNGRPGRFSAFFDALASSVLKIKPSSSGDVAALVGLGRFWGRGHMLQQ